MDTNGLLLSVAALAVSIAGFSGVVTALRSDPRQWVFADSLRVRTLLQFSLGTVFLCLVSIVLSNTGLTTSTIWRLSSGTTVLVAAPTTILFAWKVVQRKGTQEIAPLSQPLLWSLWAVTVIVLIIQVLNCIAWPVATQFWPFLVALVWGITNSSIAFYRIIFNRPDEHGEHWRVIQANARTT